MKTTNHKLSFLNKKKSWLKKKKLNYLKAPVVGELRNLLNARPGVLSRGAQAPEYELQLVLHRSAGEERAPCYHLVHDAPHAPKIYNTFC